MERDIPRDWDQEDQEVCCVIDYVYQKKTKDQD